MKNLLCEVSLSQAKFILFVKVFYTRIGKYISHHKNNIFSQELQIFVRLCEANVIKLCSALTFHFMG